MPIGYAPLEDAAAWGRGFGQSLGGIMLQAPQQRRQNAFEQERIGLQGRSLDNQLAMRQMMAQLQQQYHTGYLNLQQNKADNQVNHWNDQNDLGFQRLAEYARKNNISLEEAQMRDETLRGAIRYNNMPVPGGTLSQQPQPQSQSQQGLDQQPPQNPAPIPTFTPEPVRIAPTMTANQYNNTYRQLGMDAARFAGLDFSQPTNAPYASIYSGLTNQMGTLKQQYPQYNGMQQTGLPSAPSIPSGIRPSSALKQNSNGTFDYIP